MPLRDPGESNGPDGHGALRHQLNGEEAAQFLQVTVDSASTPGTMTRECLELALYEYSVPTAWMPLRWEMVTRPWPNRGVRTMGSLNCPRVLPPGSPAAWNA